MDSCRDIDPLTTRVVDDEATNAERQRVDSHARACPPCRHRVLAEQQARHLVREHAGALVGHAPLGLRTKCAASRASAGAPSARPMPLLSRARWPTALAATLVLAVAGSALYGLVINPSQAAAAQLTLDHLKCFILFEEPAGLDPGTVQAALKARHGIDLIVPTGAQAAGLTLVGGRRCVYLDGKLAHLLYRRGAVAVSLFVLPPGAKLSHTELDVLGHSAVAFTKGGRTWVVVARAPREEMALVASAFRAGAE